MRITLEDIFNLPTAVIYYPEKYKSVTSVSIDTRTMKKNSLFVAIKGKNFDGHNYVKEAVKKGASAVLVGSKKLDMFKNIRIPIISVRNTIDAYAMLAKLWRNKLKGKVISITGSNGKTTTKEMLAQLLSSKYKVHKTFLNNNNQIGVPLTILSAPSNSDFIVLEHGTNHFGEIKFTSKIANPDFALITNIGNSHNKYLESKKEILKEKLELFNYTKDNGVLFINNDDPLISGVKQNYKNKITFGFKGKCDVKGKIIKDVETKRKKISIQGFGKNVETSIPLLGEVNSRNFLAAVSVALKCGLHKTDIVRTAKKLRSIKGRLQIKNHKNFTVIDDTYNSNPDSVRSALEVIGNFDNRYRKIAVLGDMFELGEKSDEFHKNLAENVSKAKINEVYTIGRKTKLLHDDLNDHVIKKHFVNRMQLRKFLVQLNLNNSVILVKGSRGMKMEEFVNIVEEREK